MDLINRYVKEVGKQLPFFTGRTDIEKELRSTLEDMLEDRAQKAGKPADETLELELLKEYGPPQKVAMSYNPYANPHPYLIGPQIYPFFIMILRVVVLWTTIGLTIVMGIQLYSQFPMTSSEAMNTILKGIGNIISTNVAAFGYLALTFILIERLGAASDFKIDEDENWDPSILKQQPDTNRVNHVELIIEIVFSLIGLAILNGIFNIPIFKEGFEKFVPWINTVFIVEVLVNIFLLRSGLWSRTTRFSKVVIEAIGVVITYFIIQTPNVIGSPTEAFTPSLENTMDFDTFMSIFNLIVPIGLVIVLIIQLIELIKTVRHFVKDLRAEQ